MSLRIVVAHPEIIYKQALSSALELFEDLTVVNQARYYDELLNIVQRELPDFVIASEEVFGNIQRLRDVADEYHGVNFIVLTKKSEDALTDVRPNVHGFLTFGYLIDLYRLIKSIVENKKFAQPAVIKNVLSTLRKMEESGISTETLLLGLDQKKVSILVDIILGKSFDEICFKHEMEPEELNAQIEKIIQSVRSLLKSCGQAEDKR